MMVLDVNTIHEGRVGEHTVGSSSLKLCRIEGRQRVYRVTHIGGNHRSFEAGCLRSTPDKCVASLAINWNLELISFYGIVDMRFRWQHLESLHWKTEWSRRKDAARTDFEMSILESLLETEPITMSALLVKVIWCQCTCVSLSAS